MQNSFLRTFRLVVGITACLFLAVTAARAELTDGLIGYWPLDGDFVDASPDGGHDGVMINNGNSDFTAGVHGDGIDLDGGSQYIEIGGDESDFDFEAADMSFSAWFRVDGFTKSWQALLAKGEGDRWRVHRRGGDQEMTWNGGRNDVPGGTPNVNDGEFHHIAGVTRHGVDVRMWIDGELVSTGVAGSLQNNDRPVQIGDNPDTGNRSWDGVIDDVAIWDRALEDDEVVGIFEASHAIGIVEAFLLDGSGQTYEQDFDEHLALKTGSIPRGWNAMLADGKSRSIKSYGLQDGPLGIGGDAVIGLANVGGNANRFDSPDANTVATWQAELGGDSSVFDGGDVVADGATDRALGIVRLAPDDDGSLNFEIEIGNKPLGALVVDWDLEVWGGDPEAAYRGADGAGFAHDVSVGGTSYYTTTESLVPGDTFNTFDDGFDNSGSPTLIDGNAHSSRGMTSGLLEIDAADGAVGNFVEVSFDSNFGGADEGWIPAIDNVRVRAVAPGDVDGNGSVDPLDIVELLKGGQFGKGVNGVTWQQGDFNGDDQFDPNDLVAVLTFLSGEFPRTYASELGNGGDGTPDVIVDLADGSVTIDFAGHISSSIIVDSAAGIFNGDAPAWDTMGEFRTASANQISNTLFSGTESGVDGLGNLVKAEFLSSDEAFFLSDLTVKILVATPDGPVTVDGHVIVVPEPSTWMLLGLGSLALIGVVRRRKA